MSNEEIFKRFKEIQASHWAVRILWSMRFSKSPQEDLLASLLKGNEESVVLMRDYIITHVVKRQCKPGEEVDSKLVIKISDQKLPYYTLLSELVVRNLQLIQTTDLRAETPFAVKNILIANESLEDFLNAEVEVLREHLKNDGVYEGMKVIVSEGINGFGMWMLEMEQDNKSYFYFDTYLFCRSDALDLLYDECIRFFYFLCSRAVANQS